MGRPTRAAGFIFVAAMAVAHRHSHSPYRIPPKSDPDPDCDSAKASLSLPLFCSPHSSMSMHRLSTYHVFHHAIDQSRRSHPTIVKKFHSSISISPFTHSMTATKISAMISVRKGGKKKRKSGSRYRVHGSDASFTYASRGKRQKRERKKESNAFAPLHVKSQMDRPAPPLSKQT